MTFKTVLVILVMTANGWIVDRRDGWQPREQPDWNTCIERRDFFNNNRPPEDTRRAVCRKRMGL